MNRSSEESFFLYHNFTPRRGDRSIARGEIDLDLDATDDPLQGNQEGRFFHGHYGSYCYLPLYIFCRHLLAARLRHANIDAAAGSVEEVSRIVNHVRGHRPKVRMGVARRLGVCT